MENARRLAYLNAMGIDSYYRRDSLAAAPPISVEQVASTGKILDVVPDAEAAPEAMKPAGNAQQPRVPARQPIESLQAERPADQQQESVNGEVANGQLRFSFQYYAVSENLAVINEVPFRGEQHGPASAASKLLVEILRALGQPAGELATPARFNWPLGSEDNASQSRSLEATDALEGFLRRCTLKSGRRVVVVFAGQLQSLFMGSGAHKLLTRSDVQVFYTHSLDTLLKVPGLKAETWQTIRGVSTVLQS